MLAMPRWTASVRTSPNTVLGRPGGSTSAIILVLQLLSVQTSFKQQLTFEPLNRVSPHGIRSVPDTSNLIFVSVADLLQQWPNSLYPSGHSIVPGIIPSGTRLYHGSKEGAPEPTRTEWLAFDPNMSYTIHAVHSHWGKNELLTYVSTRPLRVIYFDGQSASLGAVGHMDSQTAIINGSVPSESPPGSPLAAEYVRAKELCRMGREWGFEGVVRMNTGFELIWCDFQTGIELMSRINTTDPLSQGDDGEMPFYARGRWEWARTATMRYHRPELRVKLDLDGLVSFYDRLSSLDHQRARRGVELDRAQHRMDGISPSDAALVTDRLKAILARKNKADWQSSEDVIDWSILIRTVIDHYEMRLRELVTVLRGEMNTIPKEVRRVTYGMLMAYLDMGQTPHGTNVENLDRCVGAFTDGPAFANRQSIESVIFGAVHGTLKHICTTLLNVFSESFELSLLDPSNPTIERNVTSWRTQVDDLVKWLGWPTDSDCSEKCASNELCLVPMWPMSALISAESWPRCTKPEEIRWKQLPTHNFDD